MDTNNSYISRIQPPYKQTSLSMEQSPPPFSRPNKPSPQQTSADKCLSKEHLPRHIAIVMDGNGRWAKRRSLPRVAGHRVGAKNVSTIVRACIARNIEMLTLWAFSTENWQRPIDEVNFLMNLMTKVLRKEARELHANNVRVRIVGDKTVLPQQLRQAIMDVEELTAHNTSLKLIVAVNYSGRWDITQATQKIGEKIAANTLSVNAITEDVICANLALADFPDPDLLIRTSGEKRLSNFLLWQLSYSEIYFTDVLWPDFREEELDIALGDYAKRERRFGKISEQL